MTRTVLFCKTYPDRRECSGYRDGQCLYCRRVDSVEADFCDGCRLEITENVIRHDGRMLCEACAGRIREEVEPWALQC